MIEFLMGAAAFLAGLLVGEIARVVFPDLADAIDRGIAWLMDVVSGPKE